MVIFNIRTYTKDSSGQDSEAMKKGLLERLLDTEVVIGDGGFTFALEKRGYVKMGNWTPEAVADNPEAVRQLHREFLRAGSNVMQAFTFNSSEDKFRNQHKEAAEKYVAYINKAACALAREVAAEGDALVAGGISPQTTCISGVDKENALKDFQKHVDVFVNEKVDFLIAEYFDNIEEIEWAIESLKTSALPVCASMSIGPEGDRHGVSVGECAVRMARAGADVVGVNCRFGPFVSLKTITLMKEALDEAGIKVYLMVQALGYHTPDAGKRGFMDLKEYPAGLEPHTVTRFDMNKYARQAYDIGVRYIGGCCGIEPYHIRAICEELQEKEISYQS